MVDAISGDGDIAAAAIAQKQQTVGTEVEIAVMKKALDTKSDAVLQLLQQMGIGNNVNALV